MSESNSILDELNSKKQLEEKQNMGPRWNEEELEIFLHYFRQSGLKDLELMQSRLQGAGYYRTANNLISVYMKNKNFLKINDNCTAKDFSAIMTDHYETLENEYGNSDRNQAMDIENESYRDVRKGSNAGRIYRTTESKLPRLESNSASKRRNTKSKRMTGSRIYDQDENGENASRPRKGPMNYENNSFREKNKKPRKSSFINSKNVPNLELDDPNFIKKIGAQLRTSSHKRNRKFSSTNSKKPIDDQSSQSLVKYVICECFYSSMDRPYFEFNEFRAILGPEFEDRPLKLKRAEWAKIRGLIGKPRRFSSYFIKQQVEELNNYRNNVRGYLNKKINLNDVDIHPDLAEKVKEIQSLQVSQPVFALLPGCDFFYSGSILTTSGTNAIVKFPNELGAMNIPDIRILVLPSDDESDGQGSPDKDGNNSVDSETKPSKQQNLLQEIDFYAMALFIKILERKTALINEMRNFNDLAEDNPSILNERFYQEYGWTGVQINLLDSALKHISAKWRLRGLHNFNVNQIMQNFDKIIANPIKNFIEMEQRKAETEQDIDHKFIKDIKSALNQNLELKIEEKIKDLNRRYNEIKNDNVMKQEIESINTKFESPVKVENENENAQNGDNLEEIAQENALRAVLKEDINEEKSESLKKMVENIIGVLLSLKQSRDLVLTENHYLTDLCDNIYEENPNEFHEINNLLLNISSK